MGAAGRDDSSRVGFKGFASALAVIGLLTATPSAAETPTFTKDIAPIFYKRCVACHRAGAVAPMSLLTHADARPWARSIKQKVTERAMPPWAADRSIGRWANDPSLTDAEIQRVAAWVDGGAPEGAPADLPPAPTFTDGWTIGTPDLIFTVPAVKVPADGAVPYTAVYLPTNLKKDLWLQGVEFRPKDRRAVHHIIATLVEPGTRREVGTLGHYVPGSTDMLIPAGMARLLPANTQIKLQLHYTTFGEAVTEVTEIGLLLAKAPPSSLRRVSNYSITKRRFAIPPGAPNHEVTSTDTLTQDLLVTSLHPHMHVRGKDFRYVVTYPDGREETLLWVPKYDFNWQTTYDYPEPKRLPKGSTITAIAHFDNSPGNRYNPDPTATVVWGEQTWQEMFIGYMGIVDPEPPSRSTAGR